MKQNNMTDMIEQQHVPCMALVVYRNDKTGGLYMELHRINGKGRMLAGQPLTVKCISELADSFAAERGDIPHGILPDNMLFCDSRKGFERYVWYNPPCKRMMFFHSKLNIKDGEYALPGLIYSTCGEHLTIYAFREEKPEMNTVLYKAPLFNVREEKVCLGNSQIHCPENPSFRDYIGYWEKKFWQSEFSHLGANGNPTKNNLVAVTKNAKESFDYRELIPFEKNGKTVTLNDILP